MIPVDDLVAAVLVDFGVPLLGLSATGLPYGRQIGSALSEVKARGDGGENVVMLVPARTDTRWWWDYARVGEVHFLRGRVRFAGQRSGAPFPSAVVAFGPAADPSITWWWDVRTGERFTVPVTYWERAA